jgi:hypothetical protein
MTCKWIMTKMYTWFLGRMDELLWEK